ncbi:MAG: MOSC domain-containing protein YiiM [Glaciecola sp.]
MSAGRVVAVCLGAGGIPKQQVLEAQVNRMGLAGDKQRHPEHGGENRAVCLFSTADYTSLQRDGVSANTPGSFGENLLIEGLSFDDLSPGDQLAIGDQVVLEIHDCREPCVTLLSVDERFPALMEGRSGFVCRVIQGGRLVPHASVSRIDPR